MKIVRINVTGHPGRLKFDVENGPVPRIGTRFGKGIKLGLVVLPCNRTSPPALVDRKVVDADIVFDEKYRFHTIAEAPEGQTGRLVALSLPWYFTPHAEFNAEFVCSDQARDGATYLFRLKHSAVISITQRRGREVLLRFIIENGVCRMKEFSRSQRLEWEYNRELEQRFAEAARDKEEAKAKAEAEAKAKRKATKKSRVNRRKKVKVVRKGTAPRPSVASVIGVVGSVASKATSDKVKTTAGKP